MAQFDPSLFLPTMGFLTLTGAVCYWLSITTLISQFAGIGKFKEKKLSSLYSFYTSLISKVSNTIKKMYPFKSTKTISLIAFFNILIISLFL